MNIIETRIPDITKSNVDKSKSLLVEKIISNIQPLLNV